MKHIYKAIAIGLVVMPLSMVAYAGEHDMSDMEKHEGMEQHEGKPGSGMGGDRVDTERLKEMQAHLLLMHDLSNKILAEKDPKKQQALKDQQLELMRKHMVDRMAKRHHAPPPPPAPAAPKK